MQLLHYNYSIEQLGKRYTLKSHLGSGNMADVHLAWDEYDMQNVAVKVIKPNMLNPKLLRRFAREGKIASSLRHPNIIHIEICEEETLVDAGLAGVNRSDVPYIVMEYVEGGSLKDWLELKRRCSLAEILCIFEQLCAAVQYLHYKGVIHRDIKPANILFRESPQQGAQIEIVLSDFGLALLVGDTHYSLPEAGTPAYMAREQWEGKPEHASDIFSLGVVLYELCTGHLPPSLKPPEKPTLFNPSLPPALDDVILCALSKEPSQRFASASLFWQALKSAVGGTPLPPIVSVSPLSAIPSSADKGQQDSTSTILLVDPENTVPDTEEQLASSPLPSTSAEADIAGVKTASIPGRSPIPEAAKPTEKLLPSTIGARSLPRGRPRRASPKRNWQSRIIVALATVVLPSLVLGGLIVWANLNFSATITITADKTIQDTYQIQGVTSNANPDNRQVTVRQLTSTKNVTETVNATGHVETEAVSATGSLMFFNSSANSVELQSGTHIDVNGLKGIALITDQVAHIPAANNPGKDYGNTSVKSHIEQKGKIGNIANGALYQYCCASDNSIRVTNTDFTGGQDAKNYTFLQQTDITPVINKHQATLENDVRNDVSSQIKSSEQLLDDISCQDPTSKSDPPVGAHDVDVTTANVTVSVTCNAVVYDANTVRTMAQNALKQKVDKDPTLAGYVLIGAILTQVQLPQTQQEGTLTFSVAVRGVWSYQWTDANKRTLLNKIKGKSVKEAQAILNPYVSNAKIDVSNGGSTLPNDVSQIKLVVNPVKGP